MERGDGTDLLRSGDFRRVSGMDGVWAEVGVLGWSYKVSAPYRLLGKEEERAAMPQPISFSSSYPLSHWSWTWPWSPREEG
jgi:hypothetical protein